MPLTMNEIGLPVEIEIGLDRGLGLTSDGYRELADGLPSSVPEVRPGCGHRARMAGRDPSDVAMIEYIRSCVVTPVKEACQPLSLASDLG